MREKPVRLPSPVNRRILLLLAAIFLVLLGYTSFRDVGILGTWRLTRMQEQLEFDNRRLSDENARLKAEVYDLLHNEKRIEAEARKIGLMYPDEIAFYWKLDNGATARMFVRPANPAPPLPVAPSGSVRPLRGPLTP